MSFWREVGCVVQGHTAPYLFYGVPHCSRCWTRLDQSPTTKECEPMTEAHLEVLIQNGWSIRAIRDTYPSLHRFLPE